MGIRYVNKKIVLFNFLWRFAERIAAQLITFIVSIIIARLVSPEVYGAVAILMVFITIANVIVNNGFATALIQKKDADNLDFSSVFYFSILFSITLYILFFCLAPFIAKWYNMPVLCLALRIMGIRIIIGAINSVQQSYVARNMMFKKFFYSTLGGTIGSCVVGVVLAFSGFGIWALVYQYLFNTTIDTIVLWFTVKWRPQKCFSLIRLKRLLSFGWKLLAAALIGALYDDLRTLIIGKEYTSSQLAFYSKGQQFPSLIMNNVNTSVTSVLFPVLSKMQNDYTEVAESTSKLVHILTTVTAPLLFGLAAISTPLIELLLTDKWIDCAVYVRLWCIYYLITLIYNAYLQSYKAIGRSGLALIIELVDDIIGIILVVCFFRVSVKAIAIVTIVSRIIAFITCIIVNKKIFEKNIKCQIKDTGMPICIAIIMFLIVSGLCFLDINNIYLLILQIFTGSCVYIGLAYLIKLPGLLELIKILRR